MPFPKQRHARLTPDMLDNSISVEAAIMHVVNGFCGSNQFIEEFLTPTGERIQIPSGYSNCDLYVCVYACMVI